jgi:hypothetical protein
MKSMLERAWKALCAPEARPSEWALLRIILVALGATTAVKVVDALAPLVGAAPH